MTTLEELDLGFQCKNSGSRGAAGQQSEVIQGGGKDSAAFERDGSGEGEKKVGEVKDGKKKDTMYHN